MRPISPHARQHIATLDGLRGVAALAVLIYHIDGKILHRFAFPYAHLAVDFFFMLSGFVIARAYESRLMLGMSLSQFTGMRLRRLYPMIFVGIAVGIFSLGMRYFFKHDISLANMAIAVFFALLLLPSRALSTISPEGLYVINVPHWSLFFEMVINVIYAGLVRGLNNRILIIVCTLSGLVLLITPIKAGPTLPQDGNIYRFFLTGFVRVTFPFTIGILLFRYNRAVRFTRDYSLILCLSFFPLLLCTALPWNWYVELALIAIVFPAILFVGANCPNNSCNKWPLLALGELSYPLYATHEPLIRIFYNAAQVLKIDGHIAALGTACFVTAVVFAALALIFWDLPLRRWLNAKAL